MSPRKITPSTPAEFFKQEFDIARDRGVEVNLAAILLDIARDANDITINGKPLEELLAAEPEPLITQDKLNSLSQGNNIGQNLTQKLCLIMRENLKLDKCVYEEKDPITLTQATKNALALLSQKGFSHLAHNVGALSMIHEGYVVSEDSAVVKMDLSLDSAGIKISSSCKIHYMKSFSAQGDLGSLIDKSSPLIEFSNTVTLPVTAGTLQIDRDNKLLFGPSRLSVIVNPDVLQDSDPKFASLKAMHGKAPAIIDDEFDALTEETIDLRTSPLSSTHTEGIAREILDMKASLEAEKSHGLGLFFNRARHKLFLSILEQATDCLNNPTQDKIASLQKLKFNQKETRMIELIKNVVDMSSKGLELMHTPYSNKRL